MKAAIDPKDIVLLEISLHGVDEYTANHKFVNTVIRIKGRSDTIITQKFIDNHLKTMWDFRVSHDLIPLWRAIIKFNQYIPFEDIPNSK